jgi:hypothetical protein
MSGEYLCRLARQYQLKSKLRLARKQTGLKHRYLAPYCYRFTKRIRKAVLGLLRSDKDLMYERFSTVHPQEKSFSRVAILYVTPVKAWRQVLQVFMKDMRFDDTNLFCTTILYDLFFVRCLENVHGDGEQCLETFIDMFLRFYVTGKYDEDFYKCIRCALFAGAPVQFFERIFEKAPELQNWQTWQQGLDRDVFKELVDDIEWLPFDSASHDHDTSAYFCNLWKSLLLIGGIDCIQRILFMIVQEKEARKEDQDALRKLDMLFSNLNLAQQTETFCNA